MTACATACVESMLARRIHVLRITLGPSAERNSVAVNVSGQVLGAFQALGAQAGASATVEVDPLHHQVQVVHHV